MEVIRSYLGCVMAYVDWAILSTERQFNKFANQIDFTAFCIVYTIVLVWVLRKFNKPQPTFRPKNKELVNWKTQLKKDITSSIMNLPIIKQIVQSQFKKEIKKATDSFHQSLLKHRDPKQTNSLPPQGMKGVNLEAKVKKWFETQEKVLFTGKVSGAIYPESYDHCKEVSDFAAKYMYHNPLHLDTYKQLGKMEAEVLKMTSELISKNKVYGLITSGGSQSLIMTLHAYKTCFKRSRPNIVVPVTIHAAVDKGAHYFNIEVRKARLNKNFEVDISHMKSLIDSNTIALYGSYGNYPHGTIDPMQEIAALAKRYNIGCHLDACLGGFVAAFLDEHKNKCTIDIDGVTSISLDHHKYALAPKGVATLFFKSNELRHHMYFVYPDWVGGVYATPSFPGSRSGFASAGAWYALTHYGRKNYQNNSIRVSEATKKVAQDLAKIKGVEVFGQPKLCALAFNTTIVDCYAVSEALGKRGWKISAIHHPRGMHISVTPSNCVAMRENLARDVGEIVMQLQKNPPAKQGQTAQMYGASQAIPSKAMGEELMRSMWSTTYK